MHGIRFPTPLKAALGCWRNDCVPWCPKKLITMTMLGTKRGISRAVQLEAGPAETRKRRRQSTRGILELDDTLMCTLVVCCVENLTKLRASCRGLRDVLESEDTWRIVCLQRHTRRPHLKLIQFRYRAITICRCAASHSRALGNRRCWVHASQPLDRSVIDFFE